MRIEYMDNGIKITGSKITEKDTWKLLACLSELRRIGVELTVVKMRNEQ
jgi:hypothetical protein